MSAHHAYALLLEELDEYWDLVRAQQHDHEAMYHELLDLAAVATRAASEIHRQNMLNADPIASRRSGVPPSNLVLTTSPVQSWKSAP
jgi:hypothetical protein